MTLLVSYFSKTTRLRSRDCDGVCRQGPLGIGTLLTEHDVMMILGNIKKKQPDAHVCFIFIFWEFTINNCGLDISHFRQKKTNKLESRVYHDFKRFLNFSFISWKTIRNSKRLLSNVKVNETLVQFFFKRKFLFNVLLIKEVIDEKYKSWDNFGLGYPYRKSLLKRTFGNMPQYSLPHCDASKAKTFIKIINILNFWSKALLWQLIENNCSGNFHCVDKYKTAIIFLSSIWGFWHVEKI